jgi:polar amino acid transport system substrate-binding protein
MSTVADTFGVKDSLTINGQTSNPLADATDNSWEEIKASKKIVIGYTVFAPIAYEIDGKLSGFDIELAKQTVAYLNETYGTDIEVEFMVIDWNAKEALLNAKTIDLIWNGMTITPKRAEAMCISVPYLANRQVAVVKTENVGNYTDAASFADAVIGVEKGSAGMSVVKGK